MVVKLFGRTRHFDLRQDSLFSYTPMFGCAFSSAACGQSTSEESASNAPAANPAGSGLNTRPDQGSFFRRLFRTYADDWKPLAAVAAAAAPAPAFRGDPAPVNGPPFPFSTWPIGGTVSIGQPWTQAGPLMTALWTGPDGDFWKKSKIQIYGWLNVGGNFSTTKGGVNPSAGKYDNLALHDNL